MAIAEPRCSVRRCKHLQGVLQPSGDETGGEFPFCPAFPKGIPDSIAYGADLHLVKVPGQVGEIVYEKEAE